MKSPAAAMSRTDAASIEEQLQNHGHGSENSIQGQCYRLSVFHSIFKRYLETTLLFFGWDLFAVYKHKYEHNGHRAEYRARFPPELRISQDSFDKWQRCVRVPFSIVICYLVFRLTTVGLIKIADVVLLDAYIFNATRLQGLGDSSQAQLMAFLTTSPIQDMMPTYYRTTIQQVVKLRHAVREPFD